ncbi:MAG: hypothetical protein IPN76_29730 [Saprospiraceae bacterium]|nr:hypothetical protein [Saprospiraceae bacterium]
MDTIPPPQSPAMRQAAAPLPGGRWLKHQLFHLGVGPGYKVRSQRNPVEPKSRGGVHRSPLLLRERRCCLAGSGRLSGRQGCGGALGVSLAAPLKTGGRGRWGSHNC